MSLRLEPAWFSAALGVGAKSAVIVLPVVECVPKHIVVLPNPDRIPSQDEHGSAVCTQKLMSVIGSLMWVQT